MYLVIELTDLIDVDLVTTPPSDLQTLLYDSASGTWKPGDSGAGSGVTVEAGSVQTDGSILWRWAIDATTGQPYFDDAGVTSGEEGIVKLTSGRFYIEEAGL